MLTPSFGCIGRGEYRDALVWLGTERGLPHEVVARDGRACAG